MRRGLRFARALVLVVAYDVLKPRGPRWLAELAQVGECLLWAELVENVAGVAR